MLQKSKGNELSRDITAYVLENGAISVGISTRETLLDSPPSADITYLMANGLSAIAFVLPMNKAHIRTFLAKEDHLAYMLDEFETNIRARKLSDALSAMLKEEGYQAIGTATNARYRIEVENWYTFLPPEISHRYLAVVSGAGSFGWSGNVGVKGYGTAVVLGTTITDAQLEPTFPIPEEDGFCSNCKACARACPVEMFSDTEKMSIRLGGREYSHSARIDLNRCFQACNGCTGLHKSKKWSSWSPGRFEVPEANRNTLEWHTRNMSLQSKWVQPEGFSLSEWFSIDTDTTIPRTPKPDQYLTCGNCRVVCTGDKKENLENLKTLHDSGCVIQYPDGSLKVLPGDEAEAEFDRMPPEHRALYC